jgi:hypothetical protein
MNRHFQRDASWDAQLPSRAFARVDHVVPPEQGSSTVLWALDAIDADWLAFVGKLDPRFNLDDPDGVAVAWLKSGSGARAAVQSQSPFEKAPLYRIEVEFPLGSSPMGLPSPPDYQDVGHAQGGLGALERAWFELAVSPRPNGGASALVYPGLFAQPVSAYVTGRMPSVQRGRALSGIFSLGNLPAISTAQFAQGLASSSADYLSAYDVGQGNSNALLKASGVNGLPSLYFDLGAGVYRNQHTTPSPLVFCFTLSPPIILSHWDADHWAGAYASSMGGTYPALARTWFAPLQSPGPVHIAFAHDVLANGGTIYTYSPAPTTVGAVSLSPTRQLRFTIGTGSDRNNTGIVLVIEDTGLSPPRSWLLTGDCDYAFFVQHLAPLPPVALVVPHHGASLSPLSPAPAPVSPSAYRRIIYSFGAGNLHGKTNVQHPTPAGVQLHVNVGWQHGAWNPGAPGSCTAGADVLETEIHGSVGAGVGQLGGCVVDWMIKPPIVSPLCGLTQCSTAITRS